MRVAVASMEKRENEFKDHINTRKALRGVADVLHDCKVICCTQAGADAVEFFARRGVELDMSDGPIDEKLKGFIESFF